MAAAVILACVLVKGNKKAVAGKTGSNSAATATGKLAYGADDLDSLISDSPYIVVAQATGEQSEQKYQDVNFETTKLNVQSVLKGDITAGEQISLLQTVSDNDPIVSKDSTVLLFLEKYNGPVPGAEASFVCKGGYQGNYIVSNGEISPSKNSNKKLSEDIEKIKNLDALKQKIQSML